ncbi:proteasome subunit alpha [Tessaracoccus caeni]|uniref:proteasome subunit alpha n=1 Tax=Tessaracoccus caeni TaxID=3031239 RepID=UPI0023DA779D|nr:proteasome subunit alpha [Tessaracoccus caeni]MDF1489989.1 proteasome subunit alpha [Tessaracoccus caeni]
MSTPFGYISPEQLMQDRAEFARKGIARGRSVAMLRYQDGIAMVAENLSTTLHKISEIYDRIGFGAVGRYHEFEALRIAGIRQADLRGYSYDRSDVSGRSLAVSYSQLLGGAFSSGSEKPFEVELLVGELGLTPEADVIYRVAYDGVITDHAQSAVIGGEAEQVASRLRASHRPDAPLTEAIATAARALGGSEALAASHLEVAVLDRNSRLRRTFRRLPADEVAALREATDE